MHVPAAEAHTHIALRHNTHFSCGVLAVRFARNALFASGAQSEPLSSKPDSTVPTNLVSDLSCYNSVRSRQSAATNNPAQISAYLGNTLARQPPLICMAWSANNFQFPWCQNRQHSFRFARDAERPEFARAEYTLAPCVLVCTNIW